MDVDLKTALGLLVRHGLTTLGGVLIHYGVLSSDRISGVVGAGMVLGGIFLSLRQKTRQGPSEHRDRGIAWTQAMTAQSPAGGNHIGWAIHKLEHGYKVRRTGWNGKKMHLVLQVPDAHSRMTLPYVYMYTAPRNLVPWLWSQPDLLAKDWELA